MRTIFTKTNSIVVLLLLFQSHLFSQETSVFSTNCGTSVNINNICSSQTIFTVEVSGQPILGEGNFGIVEAFVGLREFTPGPFNNKITLVAPNGDRFTLATNQLSFPNFNGPSPLSVGFRNCGNYPSHDDPNATDFTNTIFKSQTDFSVLNDGSFNPNGTWRFEICSSNDTRDARVDCARLKFGPIAPVLIDVPEDQVIYLNDDACIVSFIMKDPSYRDTCNIETANVIYPVGNFPDSGDTFNIEPGESFPYSISETGVFNFIWEVVNSSGLITTDTTTITVEDNTGPVISGIPGDITIGCTEPLPEIPTPSAFDICQGDVTNSLQLQVNNISGNCAFNGTSETKTYTWTAQDIYGNTSQASWIVTVTNDVQIDLGQNIIACAGESVTLIPTGFNVEETTWSTGSTASQITVTESGTYSVTAYNFSGCCSSDEITVTFLDNPEVNATGGEIGCNNTSVMLTANSTTAGATYNWSGPNGYTSTQQNPTVTTEGDYELTVQFGSCSTTTTVEVVANTDVPNLSTSGITTLDCNNTSITLTATSTTPNVTYLWEGPNGAIYNTPMIDIYGGGEGDYTITVTSTNGCSNTSTITVDSDFISAPTVIATNGGSLNCVNPTFTFDITIVESDVSYSWTGPNGFTSNLLNPTVDVEGAYILNVILNANGCNTTIGFDVFEDFEEPVVNASVIGSIDCQTTSVLLQANANLFSTFDWTGPNGFTSTEQNPIVTQGGNYTVTATGENGCTSQAMVTVEQNGDLPDVSTAGGLLNCNQTFTTISASSNTAGVTYAWTGPNNFMSTEANPTTNIAGTYHVTVTSLNGCSSQGMTIVSEDFSAPTISSSNQILTCTETSVTLDLTTTPSTGVTYDWIGPNGFTSTAQQPTVSVIGTYTVIATLEATGCTSFATFSVASNFSEPNLTANGGDIDCNNTSVMLTANSTTAGVTFIWSGPNGYSSTEQNPLVSAAGDYTVTATGENGCTTVSTVTVNASEDLPEATLDVNAVDCDNNEVTIDVTANGDYTYEWTLNGNVIAAVASVTISEAGTYNLEVSTMNGCVTNLSYTLAEDIQDLLAEVTTTAATNGNDGTATIDVTNTNLTTSILWDNGQTSTTATGLSAGAHTVIVTSAYGCIFTYNFNIDMATPVIDDEEILSTLTIYPSPFINQLNLSAVLKSTSDVRLMLFDNIGKKVFERDLGTTNNIQEVLNLHKLKDGLYHISVIIDGKIFSEQIVKM